jgi:8-oxo-dGTP pyrophosphatase MutT (NUDIX family)
MEQLLKLASSFCKIAMEKSYWGVKASGVILICKDDSTIFLAKRSAKVQEGGTWGIPGGAVDIYIDELESNNEDIIGQKSFFYYPNLDDNTYEDPDDSVFEKSAMREMEEECGAMPTLSSKLQVITYRDKEFTYKTFVFNVSLQSKREFMMLAKTNWETSKFRWFPINRLPGNIHPGLKFALSNLKV